MTEQPQNWINLSDAGIIHITAATGDDATPLSLDEFRKIADQHKTPIFDVASGELPPWMETDLVELLDKRQWRQLIILSDAITPFSIGVLMMAMEFGYDVYFVTDAISASPRSEVLRLQDTGARIFSFDCFIKEARLAAAA